MSEVAARELHDLLRERIRGAIPRQIWIDDFWLSLRHEIKFTQSHDRYRFGCMKGDFSSSELEQAIGDLARRLGKMLSDAIAAIFALDYPWKEVGGGGGRRDRAAR